MYGFCGENDYGQATCSYNGSARALDDEHALEILQSICPNVLRGKCHFIFDAYMFAKIPNYFCIVLGLLFSVFLVFKRIFII